MKKYSPEELLKLGIIDEEKFKILTSESSDKNQTKKDSKFSINMFFNILAGLLLALGIIWIIAANWGLIPDYLILTLLLLGTVGCSVWLLIWKNKGKNLEVPSIIYAGITIGTIAYIGQYFNVAANTALFLYVCLLTIASISFFSKSVLLSNAYLWLGAIYFLSVPEFLTEAFNVPSFVNNHDISFWLQIVNPIIYGIIPLCYLKFVNSTDSNDENEKEETKTWNKISKGLTNRYKRVFKDLFLVLSTYALLNGCDTLGEILLLGILLLTITYKDHKWEFNALKWIGVGAILLASCSGLYSYDSFGLAIFILAPSVIYHVTKTKLRIFKKIKEYKNDKTNEILKAQVQDGINLLIILTGLFVMFIDTTCKVIWDFNFSWIVYLVLIIAWAIYSIISGIKKLDSKQFTFGEFLLTFEIFRFIFAFEDDLMIRGISAIVIGALILIFNSKTSKKIKNAKKEEIDNE